MDKFTLYHTALYAKGWYKRENKQTIWDDLKVILSLDNYSGDLMDKHDITSVILNQCQRLDERAFKDLTMFADGISETYCWKYGYYTQSNIIWKRKDDDKLPVYDYKEAIVRYCLSNLVSCDNKTLYGDYKSPKPDYVKGLPRKNGITDKRINEVFL